MRPSLNVDVFRPGNGHQGDPWSRPWTAARSSPPPRRGPAACCCPPRSPTPAAAPAAPGSRSPARSRSRRASPPASRRTSGITLWTKVEGLERDARLQVEISPDPDFRRVIYRKPAIARASNEFAIHHRAQHSVLKPGERYHYRFVSCTVDGPVGRFTTARPADSREPARIGFFSCQDYESGYYTPHAALAAGGRPRPRHLPRRLHLREALRRRRGAQGRHGRQRRRRGADAAGVPRQVRALPLRREPARAARRASAAGDLGRPRGRGQLGRATCPAAPPRTRACRSSSAARPASRRSSSTCRAGARPATATASTAPSGSAPTPSCSCSTSAPTATTSPAATSSSRPAPTARRPAARCSARPRSSGSSTRWGARARPGRSSATR